LLPFFVEFQTCNEPVGRSRPSVIAPSGANWQAAFPRTHRPDAGRRGSSQYGFGPCARRASSSDRPRWPAGAAGPLIFEL